jgi:hypothetical protein
VQTVNESTLQVDSSLVREARSAPSPTSSSVTLMVPSRGQL